MNFAFSGLANIIIAILSLGFIILWHELGHFLAAKRVGIRVEKFSIGFGPELIGFTRGETRYCLSVLPFGGFVKMPGENPEDDTSGTPDEFSSASVEKRIFVAAAGPVMNIILGVFIFGLVYILGVTVPRSSQTTEIGYVLPEYPAAIAGIRPGDKLLAIDGRRVSQWGEIQKYILVRPGEMLEILIERDGKTVTLNVTPKLRKADIGDVGQIGIDARMDVIVRRIIPDTPAATTELQQDDRILAVNGQPIHHYESVLNAATVTGKPVTLTVQRGDKRFDITLPGETWIQVARLDAEGAASVQGIQIGDRIIKVDGEPLLRYRELIEKAERGSPLMLTMQRIQEDSTYTVQIIPELDENTGEVINLGGMLMREAFAGILLGEPYDLQKYNIVTAWGKGAERSWNTVKEVFTVVRDLVTGDVSPKYLSGPLGIVDLTARVASGGIQGLLAILAFISVNLAVVNLLPIPIADGGQIILFTMEKFSGQPLSRRKQVIIQQVGIWLIIFLFVLVTWNDTIRIIKRYI